VDLAVINAGPPKAHLGDDPDLDAVAGVDVPLRRHDERVLHDIPKPRGGATQAHESEIWASQGVKEGKGYLDDAHRLLGRDGLLCVHTVLFAPQRVMQGGRGERMNKRSFQRLAMVHQPRDDAYLVPDEVVQDGHDKVLPGPHGAVLVSFERPHRVVPVHRALALLVQAGDHAEGVVREESPVVERHAHELRGGRGAHGPAVAGEGMGR